ncbi:RHH-type rel operon transcriptional repressor/antitoxin RelB [Rhizobium leguminosarum]|uniref:Relaxosome protein TraY n=1 Tax=Rhizobium leguminosarum TaxID=384 RepID=A0AAE2SVU4_RHILE|nr:MULTISPECIES: TraY domain-containing protein [Rhizobium]MBB4288794.1 RHH-type rel operon transcriptional repressor/antitoxin RelB [Rhizobium leguminosarum]MBB4295113.1 RHH-type rel operon transcriptional repressor/antitoxin RelB [Rhizobium leguminosarum]MBB4306506.1 RHH-type rel operon transcriptional repressor/antitoxin RelB [Rhizobium leguminosarum]MBB4417912.1 RHH-type rel operon transcriptional repressor/antitoxin RelB [Rhizobium leguminosarum]MBB4432758.1 RHH-type rel operon transcript
MLVLQLPPDIEARLIELSKRTGRSKCFYARQAMIKQLDDLEDIYLAEKRLEELRRSESDTVPLGELMARYSAED